MNASTSPTENAIEKMEIKLDAVREIVTKILGALDNLNLRIEHLQKEKSQDIDRLHAGINDVHKEFNEEIDKLKRKIVLLQEFEIDAQKKLAFLKGILYAAGGVVFILQILPQIFSFVRAMVSQGQ